GRRSRWTAKLASGKTVEWEAEITEDVPDQRIAWCTVERSKLPNSGEVRFVRAPGGRGTEVHLRMEYEPPATLKLLGGALVGLAGKGLELQVENDLRRFKAVLETGEVVQSDASLTTGPHPARPAGNGARGGRR